MAEKEDECSRFLSVGEQLWQDQGRTAVCAPMPSLVLSPTSNKHNKLLVNTNNGVKEDVMLRLSKHGAVES